MYLYFWVLPSALVQACGFPSAIEVSRTIMGKVDYYQPATKRNKARTYVMGCIM